VKFCVYLCSCLRVCFTAVNEAVGFDIGHMTEILWLRLWFYVFSKR